eukprot:1160897-Pelagomonas_calceolata.AAC.14
MPATKPDLSLKLKENPELPPNQAPTETATHTPPSTAPPTLILQESTDQGWHVSTSQGLQG